MIGGTRFVGWHITHAALAAGHDVALLHRGSSGAQEFPEAEHILADRDGDLGVLSGRVFDAVIDVCAYRPVQVERLAAALDGSPRYVFVSSTSVYAPPAAPGFDESSPVLAVPEPVPDEVTDVTYGPLKVACERAAYRLFGPSTLVVRPTYVVGPRDRLARFDYWVRRIADGGEVLAPGDPDTPMQLIDVRDLGTFTVGLLGRVDGGTFHAVSPAPPFTFGAMLDAIVAAVGPAGTSLRWVPSAYLKELGVTGDDLPLWTTDPDEAAVDTASPAAAEAAGLAPRPLAQTVRETLAALDPATLTARLSRERERQILAGL